MPNFLEVVEEGTLSSQISNFLSLHNTHTFKGYPIGYIGIIVHAVSHNSALGRQGETLQKPVGSCASVFLVPVLLHLKRQRRIPRHRPTIWRMSLINVDQQEVSHWWELLYQFAEGWQLVSKRRSSGWAKVDHQWALRAGKVKKVALGSSNYLLLGTIFIVVASFRTGDVHHTGIGSIFTQFHLVVNKERGRAYHIKHIVTSIHSIWKQVALIKCEYILIWVKRHRGR